MQENPLNLRQLKNKKSSTTPMEGWRMDGKVYHPKTSTLGDFPHIAALGGFLRGILFGVSYLYMVLVI